MTTGAISTIRLRRIKTSDATGNALNWLVATCEGWAEYTNDEVFGKVFQRSPSGNLVHLRLDDTRYSEDWAEGGPIIEREAIGFSTMDGVTWIADSFVTSHQQYGPAQLVAAMRCHVSGKLGAEVDVPEDLL